MSKSTLFERIQFEYNLRIHSLKDMVEFVDKKIITEEEFHWITGYSYEGLKKSRDW